MIMNKYERMERLAERQREKYPPGTRLMLLHMNDPFAPVEPGTRGTVKSIDSMAQIHMRWDNGRTLALNSEEDAFRLLTLEELAEEQHIAEQDRDYPVMGM